MTPGSANTMIQAFMIIGIRGTISRMMQTMGIDTSHNWKKALKDHLRMNNKKMGFKERTKNSINSRKWQTDSNSRRENSSTIRRNSSMIRRNRNKMSSSTLSTYQTTQKVTTTTPSTTKMSIIPWKGPGVSTPQTRLYCLDPAIICLPLRSTDSCRWSNIVRTNRCMCKLTKLGT